MVRIRHDMLALQHPMKHVPLLCIPLYVCIQWHCGVEIGSDGVDVIAENGGDGWVGTLHAIHALA